MAYCEQLTMFANDEFINYFLYLLLFIFGAVIPDASTTSSGLKKQRVKNTEVTKLLNFLISDQEDEFGAIR